MTTLLIYKNSEVTIHVYYNANAAGYCGDHADIVLPDSPTAAVTITGEVEVEPVLARSYALTQHVAVPFWEHPEVKLPIRSTSVGDILEIPDGRRFVIETDRFQPYTGPATAWPTAPCLRSAFGAITVAALSTKGSR